MLVRETIRQALLAVSGITAITSTRIYDAQSLADNEDTGEGVLPDEVRDGTNGSIRPFMLLRFSGAVATDPGQVPQSFQRTLSVFVYSKAGYSQVETLKTLVKQTVREKFFTGDDVQVCKAVWAGDFGEFKAPEMDHAYADAVTFQLLGWDT